jgi:hypothetical protein
MILYGNEKLKYSPEQLEVLNDKLLKYFILKLKNNPKWFEGKGYEYYFYDELGDFLKSLFINNKISVFRLVGFLDANPSCVVPISSDELVILNPIDYADYDKAYSGFLLKILDNRIQILASDHNKPIDFLLSLLFSNTREETEILDMFSDRAKKAANIFFTRMHLYVSKIQLEY